MDLWTPPLSRAWAILALAALASLPAASAGADEPMFEIGLQDGRKKYDSKLFGFSIIPPRGWNVKMSAKKVEFVRMGSTGVMEMLVITFAKPEPGKEVGDIATDHMFYEKAPYDNTYKFIGLSGADIDGYEAVCMRDQRKIQNVLFEGAQYFVLHKGVVYLLAFEAPPVVFQQNQGEYARIAATFQPRG